eukprot:TRINITY_DN11772_c1_g1_i14.p2 TRINITY_DN11772_c1_g1~~TRINITY_DN11772_c1_g1_i14.p2  ORF type:complete len:137 (+),score=4.50 TRINITY_DN11772_c1_g1_i14:126-536(+)
MDATVFNYILFIFPKPAIPNSTPVGYPNGNTCQQSPTAFPTSLTAPPVVSLVAFPAVSPLAFLTTPPVNIPAAPQQYPQQWSCIADHILHRYCRPYPPQALPTRPSAGIADQTALPTAPLVALPTAPLPALPTAPS